MRGEGLLDCACVLRANRHLGGGRGPRRPHGGARRLAAGRHRAAGQARHRTRREAGSNRGPAGGPRSAPRRHNAGPRKLSRGPTSAALLVINGPSPRVPGMLGVLRPRAELCTSPSSSVLRRVHRAVAGSERQAGDHSRVHRGGILLSQRRRAIRTYTNPLQ